MQLTPEILAPLSFFERLSLRAGRLANENQRLKSASQLFATVVARPWMTLVSSARMHLVGLEQLKSLAPERGVLLASNHRSFFDMFMITTYLHRHTELCRRLYFPVRSSFFYDNPVGLGVNLAMSGLAMFPPIFREGPKRPATAAGLQFLAEVLQQPGALVGIHPEGTRGKGPDPYELLPAEPGFGKVALLGRPLVIPVFVNGLGNSFYAECRDTFLRRRDPKIVMVFGKPLELGAFADAAPDRLRSQVEVSRFVLAEIAKLGELERKVRAGLDRGLPTAEAIREAEAESAAALQA